MTTPKIDEYNPYPSFQPGQKEAITQILECLDSGDEVVTLNAPTAAGKSLDLFVIGRVLSNEFDISKVVYTTPLVALVNQLEFNNAFSAMPVLKGKRNYPCALLKAQGVPHATPEDCPFDTWANATNAMGMVCSGCTYFRARQAFMDSPFGATTLARYLVDPSIRDCCSVMLIDESASLEKTLVDRATLVLPDEVDIDDLRPSLVAYVHKIDMRIEAIKDDIEEASHRRPIDINDLRSLQKTKRSLDRESGKCHKVISHIDNETPHIIDANRQFRILEGVTEFRRMIDGLRITVLASGTPCTEIMAPEHKEIVIQHPIPVQNRMCYYYPIGSMSYQERAVTAPKMADAIEQIHGRYNRKTMVHCAAYGVAKLIYDNMPASTRKITVLQQDKAERAEDLERFLKAKRGKIMLSVYFAEGLDLKGPDYPTNIIAKLPFENISDEFVKARNEHDGWRRYNTNTAVTIMQAAGRCTRSITDYSETYILDGSWQGFFNRNKKRFQPWFVAALKTIRSLDEVVIR